MRSLKDFIEEQDIYENLCYESSNKLLEEIKKSLIIWSYTGIDNLCRIFEQSKYNFDNCEEVLKRVTKEIFRNESPKTETLKIDCSDCNTFFKYLIVNIEAVNKIEGSHEKKDNPKNTTEFSLKLIDKPFIDYNLKEIRKISYNIIHELTHAYEDYLFNQEGKTIFYDVDSKEYKKYERSLAWIRVPNKPKIREELALCGYFLDEHEKFAYLGTVEQTVKNITTKVNPNYKDFKFEEILDLFKDEYIWDCYIKINVFIDSLNKNEDNGKLKYIVWRLYNEMYKEDLSQDEIIDELNSKWEDFKKEFVVTFIEAYSDLEESMKLEAYISIDF